MTVEAREKALASGLSPLEYMLRVMRDDTEPVERRMDAAKAAAPYVHSKLTPAPPQEDPEEQTRDRLTLVIVEPAKDRWKPYGSDEWRPGTPPERLKQPAAHPGS